MPGHEDPDRRQFLGAAVALLAGRAGVTDANAGTALPPQRTPAGAANTKAGASSALGIDKAGVAGFDWGARTANIVAALWPDRCQGLVAVSGYLIANREANQQPLTPQAEYA